MEARQAPLISQARILEWVAFSFSRGSSWPRNWTCVFCIVRGLLHWRQIVYRWPTREAPKSTLALSNRHLICFFLFIHETFMWLSQKASFLLLLGFSWVSDLSKPKMEIIDFYNLISEVMHHHFYIFWSHRRLLVIWEGTAQRSGNQDVGQESLGRILEVTKRRYF